MRTLIAFLVLVTCTFAATEHPAAVAGIYEANMVVKGTSGRKVTLNLMQDGKATLRSELVGKEVTTHSGTWSAAGDEVRAEFEGGHPAPMIWKLKKGRLLPRDKTGLKLSRPR